MRAPGGAVGAPLWLGAFPLSCGWYCEACRAPATRRAVWIWLGRTAAVRLCEPCTAVASVAEVGHNANCHLDPYVSTCEAVRIELSIPGVRVCVRGRR